MNKDIRKLSRELNRQGFVVRVTKRGHLSIQRHGQTVAVLASTPSDWRSNLNGVARLRRSGFVYTASI